jgi:hypothetical protein
VTQYLLVLGAFALLIANWRSPISVLSASSNVNEWVFLLGLIATPIALTRTALRLPATVSWLGVLVAAPIALFAALSGLWIAPVLWWKLSHGQEVEPLLSRVQLGWSRVAAYRVETAYSGAMVRLRLEAPLVPGVFIGRDVAYLGTSELETTTMQAPNTVRVAFRSGDRRVSQSILVGPLFTWEDPESL